MFIARATEGAVDVNWVMSQPISVRRKYVKDLEKELKEREKALKQNR